jgi:SAM-dependent methyltransferase
MEDVTAASQPAEYLESLLDCLACPLDNSVSLSAVRNATGEVVALRSRDTEYPVVRNVPCLVPKLEEGTRGDLPLWQGRQKKMWQEYQDGSERIFTPESHTMGRQVGEIIARSAGGRYLDVGCGVLAKPAYMMATSGRVEWSGVDPFLGDIARQFPFVQGLGEYIPFLHDVFDGVLYAGTIFHLLDPRRSLRRVHNVLKPKGKLFVWYTASRIGRKYLIWRGLLALGFARWYDDDSLWGFTRKSLGTLVEGAGFAVENEICLCEACPDFSTCDHANEYLAIAHRI